MDGTKKNYFWSAYVRSLLYANASVMQTLLCVVQDNLFEWYLGMYLELEHFLHFFLLLKRGRAGKKGCKLLEEKQKQKQAAPNTKAKWKKRYKKKSMGRAHRFVQRWEKKILAVTMLFFFSVCPSSQDQGKKKMSWYANERIKKNLARFKCC